MNKKLTQKRLKEVLTYDSLTGLFAWKIDKNYNAKSGDEAGTKGTDGYIRIRVDGSRYKAHRLAFLYMDGYWPENKVDHINRIRYDNKWSNLREISDRCSVRNRDIFKSNTSGVTGVQWHKRDQRWRADITINRKRFQLGYFKEFIDAVKTRWEAEKKYNWKNCNSTSTAYKYLVDNNVIRGNCND